MLHACSAFIYVEDRGFTLFIGQITINLESKIVNIFYSIVSTFVMGAQNNHLIETILVSTHNICFVEK